MSNSIVNTAPILNYSKTILGGRKDIPAGDYPHSVRFYDLNADGLTDVLVGNSSNSASIYFNLGNGTLAQQVSVSTGGTSAYVYAADLNGDNITDIATANYYDGTISVIVGLGAGKFGTPVVYSLGGRSVITLAFADINNDGKIDIVAPIDEQNKVAVLRNDGVGGFTLNSSYSVGSSPNLIATADLNGDGFADVATSNIGNGTISVLLNNGSGGFFPQRVYSTGAWVFDFGDVNSDGHIDIVSGNGASNTLGIWLNNGSGIFTLYATKSAGRSVGSVHLVDVNGDSLIDAVTANQGNASADVFLGDGKGNFADTISLALPSMSYDTNAADLNGDGKAEIVSANTSNNISLFSVTWSSSVILDQFTTEDGAFSYTMPVGAFTDADAGDTLTYSAKMTNGTALPSWLTFNPSTRTFSGTPLQADVGTLSVKVTAKDAAGASASDTFAITVSDVNDAPIVSNQISDQSATEDTAFRYMVSANAFKDVDTGDVLTYSAQLVGGGALPPWLSFDAATRTFSGLPRNEDVGAISVRVKATDTSGLSVSDDFTLKVDNVNDVPVVTNIDGGQDVRQINSTVTGGQLNPDCLALDDGSFVVVWNSWTGSQGQGVYARRVDKDGKPIGPEIPIAVENGWQIAPSIALLQEDRFIVCWEDSSGLYGDTSGNAIVGRIYSTRDLSPQSDPFLVNTHVLDWQGSVDIAGLPGGGFAVTWIDANPYAAKDDVRLQIFDGQLAKVGRETLVTSKFSEDAIHPNVEPLSSGDIVVTWQVWQGDNSAFGVLAQLFSSGGTPKGAEFLVNTSTYRTQGMASIAALESGGFVVVWQDYSVSFKGEHFSAVRGQLFDQNGKKVGAEIKLSDMDVGSQAAPQVTALTDGGFMVIWHDADSISGRVFDELGHAQGGDQFLTKMNSIIDYRPAPVLVLQPDGSGLILWADKFKGSDLYDTEIFGQEISVVDFYSNSANATEDSIFNLQLASDAFADVDAGDALTYSAQLAGGGALPSWLTFNASTRTFSGTPANADVGSISVRVTATDLAGLYASDAFIITVGNVNDAPTITSGGKASLAENATGTVYTISATDPDAGATLTYTLGGVDAALFNINSSTGAVTFRASPNFEAPGDVGANNVYDITVQASDGTLTASKNVAISVTNVNEAPSFATGDGRVTTNVGPGPETAWSMALQPDAKILVAGWSLIAGSFDFALVRYNADGSLDTTFDGDGKLTTDFGASFDTAYCIALQPNGKILLAGTSSSDFALIRYNANGSLDTTFDGDGKLTTEFGPKIDPRYNVADLAYGLALQPDGKILVAGWSQNGRSPSNFALARYDENGTLDTSFDGDGKVTTDFEASLDAAYCIALQPNGKILLAGTGSGNFALVRYNADGSLDATFDGDGKLTTDGVPGTAWSMVLQPDGKILCAGWGYSGTNLDFGLVRYNIDGSLDTTFDADGKLTTDFGASDRATSMVLQPDGKILVAGYSGDADISLVRYNANGSLDTTFDGDGKLTTDFGSDYDFGRSMVLLPDGKILVAGERGIGDSEFALVRYNSNGSLDKTFGPQPIIAAYTENATSVVLASSLAIVDAELTAANNYAGASLTLLRQGGASSQDIFSSGSAALGSLTQGAALTVSGTSIGKVTQNSAGVLVLSFNANATQSLVNTALQSVAYANSSDAPPASVQINWVFSDGNTGAQGTGSALSATLGTTVNITSVNDAPTITSGASATFAENAIGTVYTTSATDPDAGATLTYSLIGTDAALFNINSSTGAVTFKASPNFEAPGDVGANNVYDITVQASDGTLTASKAVAISVTDVNDTETTAPTVSTFSPTDGATGVAIGSNIVLTFSEAIQKGAGLIQLRSGSATGAIFESFDAATSARLTLSGSQLTIDPTSNLANGTRYFVTFASGSIKDLAGNSFTGTSTYDFTTLAADTKAPTVSTFSPTDGATGVAVGSNIVLTFSEAIQKGAGLIQLRSGSATGAIVESFDAATSARLTLSESQLTIDPTSNLANGTRYFVTFASGSIKDLAGNSFTGTSTYDFTTASGANYITGTSGDDVLSGTSGADIINGLAGDDIVTGAAGIDVMNGGEGSDLYIIGTSADHSAAEIADTGTTGTDVIRFTTTSASTLTLYAGDSGVEAVVIGTGTGATATTTGTTAINVDASALTRAISITGNNGVNTLTGGAGDDSLFGNSGNDILVGGAGSDRLLGGLGNDTLTGGAGADVFVFDTTPNAFNNRDVISDFNVADDTIELENSIFTALGLTTGALAAGALCIGTAAGDADDRVIYKLATGALFYDADGNGPGASVQIAILGINLALTNADFVVV